MVCTRTMYWHCVCIVCVTVSTYSMHTIVVCNFPPHLCWGSPFLLPLAVPRFIAGIEVCRHPRATKVPLSLLLLLCCARLHKRLRRECIFWKAMITTLKYVSVPKAKYMTLGPIFFCCNKFAVIRRAMYLLHQYLLAGICSTLPLHSFARIGRHPPV